MSSMLCQVKWNICNYHWWYTKLLLFERRILFCTTTPIQRSLFFEIQVTLKQEYYLPGTFMLDSLNLRIICALLDWAYHSRVDLGTNLITYSYRCASAIFYDHLLSCLTPIWPLTWPTIYIPVWIGQTMNANAQAKQIHSVYNFFHHGLNCDC